MLLNQESEMKDKLLYFVENMFEAILKLAFIVWVAYMTVICVGLWGHLHNYAMSGFK